MNKFMCANGCLFMLGMHFAYKRDVVVVIKVGAYIHGVLISMGAYYRFYSILFKLKL